LVPAESGAIRACSVPAPPRGQRHGCGEQLQAHHHRRHRQRRPDIERIEWQHETGEPERPGEQLRRRRRDDHDATDTR
jgi:hypothetical protein